MHIPDVHDCSPEPTEQAKEFLSDGRKEKLKDCIEQIFDEQYERLEEYADEYISQVAADRAEKFLERVLNGDEEAAEALLGDRNNTGRTDFHGEPWAKLIHGKLFESGSVALRRRIVEANADLIRNERIADLEAQVEGLSSQIRQMQAALHRARNRLD